MRPFDFHSETQVSDAFARGAHPNTQYIAGGTTLVDLMRLHVLTPTELVDVTSLPHKKITESNNSIEVGALVTNTEMAHHVLVKEHFPFVSEALLAGASVQIRNRATTAGNILQKTRCSYYRDLNAKCNRRDPGQGCDALEGCNRMHAILGTSEHCIAAHPSDLGVALMATEAVITTNQREIEFEKFYTLPGQTPHIENVLAPGELILAVTIPKKPWFKKSTYVKIRDRSSYAFALASVALALDIKNGVIHDARIALGGVASIPWRALSVESSLRGKKLDFDLAKKAAAAAVLTAQPRGENSFKVILIQQALIRALQEVEKLT